MTNPPQLTPEMIEELDEFLLSDNAPDDSMGISDIDGLLTGIVVGPELIMPSEWIPVIWQGGDPTFEDAQQAERILGTIMGRYNEIIRELDGESDEFRPILWQAPDGTYLAADWCEGFMDAVRLRAEAWQPLLGADAMIMAPIMAHLHDSDGEPLLEELRKSSMRSGMTVPRSSRTPFRVSTTFGNHGEFRGLTPRSRPSVTLEALISTGSSPISPGRRNCRERSLRRA
jgi:yecA family protein